MRLLAKRKIGVLLSTFIQVIWSIAIGTFVLFISGFVLIAFLFYFISLYVIYDYFKKAKTILIENDTIHFGKRLYYLSDLNNYSFTETAVKKFINEKPEPVISFSFNNGSKELLYEKFYSNIPEFKQYLLQSLNLKRFDGEVTSGHTEDNFQSGVPTTYKPDLVSPFIFFKVGAVVIFFIFIFGRNLTPITAIVGVGGAYFISILFRKTYFEVTSASLAIQPKYNLFAKDKLYYFNEIREVTFGKTFKTPLIRITTTDNKTSNHLAENFSDQICKRLQKHLELYNIVVRNELTLFFLNLLKTKHNEQLPKP